MNFDFNNHEKKVVDAAYFGVAKPAISMAIVTGPNAQVFYMTPQDAKNILGVFLKSVDLYEQSYGEIANPNSPVPSPIVL